MKLRFRFPDSSTRSIIVSDGVITTSDLENIVFSEFMMVNPCLSRSIALSLNNNDVLEPATLLSEVGLVDGDLLYVIVPTNQQENQMRSETPEHQSLVDMKSPTYSRYDEARGSVSFNFCNSPTAGNSLVVHHEYASTSTPLPNVTKVKEVCSVPKFSDSQMHQIIEYLNEPVLIRDSTPNRVPSFLIHLYQKTEVSNKAEALCVILQALMFECGFIFKQEHTPCGSKSYDPLPSRSDWVTPAAYKLSYHHTSCKTVAFDLTCVTLGGNLIVHGTCAEMDTHTLFLNVNEFVDQLSSDAMKVYKKFNKLSRLFMDNIGLPLQQDLCTVLGQISRLSLLSLPHEVKLQIFSYLDVRTLLALSVTCQDFLKTASDPIIWRRLYLVTFGALTNNDLLQNWKQLYIFEYKRRQKQASSALKSFNLFPYYSVAWPYRPVPDFPQPNIGVGGIIGGPCDLHPFLGQRNRYDFIPYIVNHPRHPPHLSLPNQVPSSTLRHNIHFY